MKTSIDSLNQEIKAILIENEIKKEKDHPIKTFILNLKDEILLACVPVFGFITFITENKTMLYITIASVAAEAINLTVNYVIQKDSNVLEIPSEEHEKYFNGVYKQMYESYKLTHEKEIEENNIRHNITSIDSEILTKEETKSRFKYELDRYYDAYDLPPLYLTNKEIDIFIDKTYEFFINNHIENDYYKVISLVLRLTLARALVDKKEEIKLYDFLYNLSYINLVNNDLSLEEVKQLQEEINQTNIIPFKKRLHRVK